MTQHTPGPWTQPETKRTHNRWHVEGGGRLVAAAGGPQFAISADEADANARLIASGPDLLAALQDIIEYSKGGTWSPGDRANALRRGEAAIVKATGESQ